jgi:hypothetical protein
MANHLLKHSKMQLAFSQGYNPGCLNKENNKMGTKHQKGRKQINLGMRHLGDALMMIHVVRHGPD